MAFSSGGGTSVSGVNSEINVTPMADIMLVLLIIFMITAPLLQDGIYINKAKAIHARENPGIEAEDVTTVTVTRDGTIYVNDQEVPNDLIVERIIEGVSQAPDKPLLVRADVVAPYGRVVDVVDKARDSGVERIGLIVDRQTVEGRR